MVSVYPLPTSRNVGAVLIWALCLISSNFPGISGAAVEPLQVKRVLILHSFGRDFAPFTVASSTFRTELARQSVAPIEFLEASLETARTVEGRSETPFVEYLRALFAHRPPQLLVPFGAPAIHFLQRHRNKLFPGIPLLVGSVDKRLLTGTNLENATAAGIDLDLPAIIENILQVLPRTSRVEVIAGNSPLEKYWIKQFQREYLRFTKRIRFSWLNELSFDEIRLRAKSLPANSAILYALMIVDAAGVPYEQDRALEILRRESSAPIFGIFDIQLGLGIVGGPLYPVREEGRTTARLAMRILAGEPPDSIPNVMLKPSAAVYDWRELTRWKIDESRLPRGSVVEFRQPTFWQRYQWPIILVLATCVLEGILIDVLLRERRRRRLAQQNLEERLGFEKLLSELSGTFINLPSDRVEARIVEALGQVATLLKFDIADLTLFSGRGTDARIAFIWRSARVPEIPSDLTDKDFPWMAGELLAGRDVCLRTLEMLPPAARTDRETFEKYQVRSAYSVPLTAGGEAIGVLSLNTAWEEREMPPELLKGQRLLGEIFANALARKAAQESLQASEQNFRRLVETTAAVPWEADIETSLFTYVGPQAVELLGYPLEQWHEKEFWASHLHPDDKEYAINTRVNLSQNTEEVESAYRMIASSGKTVWIHDIVRCERENGKGAQLRGLMLDISSRKMEEETLRESEERFRTMANTAPVMIWMSGTDKFRTFFNQSWLDFTGKPMEQEIGKGWADGLHREDSDRCLDIYSDAFDARREVTMEFRLRRLDGEYRWILDTGIPRVAPDGKFLGYIGCANDITERKRAELEVVQQRAELAHITRVSTMGELSASLAHELNQPLTAILSNSQAAQRFLSAEPPNINEVREILADIVQDNTRASEVIRRMRTLVKKGQLEFSLLDLASMVREIVVLVHSDAVLRNVRVVIDCAADSPPVRGDKIQLQQVLINLLLNAFEAMKDCPTSEREVVVQTAADDGMVDLSVCDRGDGVTSQKFDKIFEPFFTTKRDGLGMGLSISRSIIEAHGGRLWAENNLERGATFHVILPVSTDAHQEN